MAMIGVDATDGSLRADARLEGPARKPVGLTVVIQAIGGINDPMRASKTVAWRFFVLVPALSRRLRVSFANGRSLVAPR